METRQKHWMESTPRATDSRPIRNEWSQKRCREKKLAKHVIHKSKTCVDTWVLVSLKMHQTEQSITLTKRQHSCPLNFIFFIMFRSQVIYGQLH